SQEFDAKLDGGRNPQRPTWGALHRRHGLLGLLDLGDDARAPFVVRGADFCHSQMAGCALKKPHAEPFFKLGGLSAESGFWKTKIASRCRKTSGLNDSGEDEHLVEIHEPYCSISGTDLPNQRALMLKVTQSG